MLINDSCVMCEKYSIIFLLSQTDSDHSEDRNLMDEGSSDGPLKG